MAKIELLPINNYCSKFNPAYQKALKVQVCDTTMPNWNYMFGQKILGIKAVQILIKNLRHFKKR